MMAGHESRLPRIRNQQGRLPDVAPGLGHAAHTHEPLDDADQDAHARLGIFGT